MKHHAHRDTRLGGYYYRGFYINKPEGTTCWNVHKVDNEGIDFCFTEAICETLREAKITIDCMIED